VTIEEATKRGIEKLTSPVWESLSPYKHIQLYFMKDGKGNILKDQHGHPMRWEWVTLHDMFGERRFVLSPEELAATDWQEWVLPR